MMKNDNMHLITQKMDLEHQKFFFLIVLIIDIFQTIIYIFMAAFLNYLKHVF